MAKKGISGMGTVVKVGETALNNVKSLDGLGGSNTTFDTTSLSSSIKTVGFGPKDVGTPSISYFFDNTAADSDFRRLKAIADAGTAAAIDITLPDGTKFAATAIISTYIDGSVEAENGIMAKCDLSMQSDWTVTNPSSSGT